MDDAMLIARLVLAATFGVAGIAKLLDLNGSREALKGFGVPARLAQPGGLALPIAEVVIAVALMTERFGWWGAVGAAVLLAIFLAAMARSMARGEAPDCHCFGQLHSEPVGWSTVVRNGVLLAISLFVVWQGRDDVGTSLGDVLGGLSRTESVLLAITSIAVLGAAGSLWLGFQLLQQQGRILLRLDEIEQRAATGHGTNGGTARDAQAGLAPGAKAPTFALPSVEGSIVTLESLLQPDKQTLLIFSDPGCGPCNMLMPKVAEWQRQHDRLNIAIVSRGTLEANREKAAQHGVGPVLLQDGHGVFDAYRVAGTPGGVVVAHGGTIAAPLARGSAEIERLVARLTQPGSASGNGRQMVGLPTGTPAPEVVLVDLDGAPLGTEHQRGERVLLFWNPTCGFCQRMLPELQRRLEEEDPALRNLVVVTRGSREQNLAMGLDATLALDSTGEVGRRFGSTGTPSAVRIDAHGKIASPLAIGATGVWRLIDESAPTPSDIVEPRTQA